MGTTIPLGFLNFDDVFLQEYRQTLIYDECGIVSVFILRDQGWRAGDEKESLDVPQSAFVQNHYGEPVATLRI